MKRACALILKLVEDLHAIFNRIKQSIPMKKRLFSAFLIVCFFISANAKVTKVFETKISATPIIGYATNDKDVAVFAGSKNFNVVQLSDGKILLDQDYKEAGTSISKGNDATVSDDLSKLVVCSKTTVSCIDLKTGKKLWDNPSFVELDNMDVVLTICDNYVLVSDKKAKENYSLSCLSMADGKVAWTLDNEKDPIKISRTYFIPTYPSVGIFTTKGKNQPNQFRIINLASGKTEVSTDMEGVPVYTLLEKVDGNLYVHNLVTEDVSYMTVFSLKDQKFLWKAKASNKSPQTPMTMNTDIIKYYATIQAFDDKVMLKTEGLEVFNAATGKPLYNIPFVPYYKWGVGHYVDGIFEPEITSKGIIIADRTSGDLSIKMMDKNTGKQIWASETFKKRNCAPNVIVTDKSAVVQFGGLNYFEVMNNTGIGKLLDPFSVTSFDLETGKQNWNIDSKSDFYYIRPANENIVIVGTKEFQTVDANTGAILNEDKNPYGDDYFRTKFGLNSMHKLQKDVTFDYSTRNVLKLEEEKLSKDSF